MSKNLSPGGPRPGPSPAGSRRETLVARTEWGLLVRASLWTTQVYTNVTHRDLAGIRSPVDELGERDGSEDEWPSATNVSARARGDQSEQSRLTAAAGDRRPPRTSGPARARAGRIRPSHRGPA